MKIIDIDATLGYVTKKVEPADTVEELIRKMDNAGVDSAVAFYTRSIKQIQPGNQDMQKIAENSGGRIKACWLLHPYLDGIQMPKKDDLLALLRKYRPAAVRLNPMSGNYLLNDFYCDELLDVLRTLRIPVMLNLTEMHNPLETVPAVTAAYPEIPFVFTDACHTNSVLVRSLLQKRPNTSIAAGFMVGCAEFDQLVNTFGAHRFLYSSTDGNAQGTALGLIYQGNFTDEEKEAMFSGNWERLQKEIQWES